MDTDETRKISDILRLKKEVRMIFIELEDTLDNVMFDIVNPAAPFRALEEVSKKLHELSREEE